MAFQVHLIPAPTGGSPSFFSFDEVSDVDPGTGRTTMHLAAIALATGPDPSIKLRVGTQTPATLVPGEAVPVDGAAGPAGLATLSGTGVLLVEIEILEPESDWQIELGASTDGTLVVADTFSQVRQAWIDAPLELAFETEVGLTVTRTLSIANRGTGPLTIDNPLAPLGSGFTLADVQPRTVAPNTCAQARIVFNAPTEPGQRTSTLQIASNDPNPSTVASHNSRVTLTAVVRRPLWAPGDILVTNRAEPSHGSIIRFSPTDGQSTLAAAGPHMVSPMGMAFEPDGNLLVADGGNRRGDQEGWLLRIDRFTGAQTVVSSGGSLAFPVAVAVASDGTIYVADAGAVVNSGSVVKIDPSTGTQTVVTMGDLLVIPSDLVLHDSGILVVGANDVFADSCTIIRVDSAGAQSDLSAEGIFVEASMRVGALALEPTGTVLVAWRHANGGGVIRFSPVAGTQQTLDRVMCNPAGIATTADGRILVAGSTISESPSVGILELDPVNGQTTVVAEGGLFENPESLAIAPQNA